MSDIDELTNLSEQHENARRVFRKKLLAIKDDELKSLYYSAVTLAEHEALRRGRAAGMEEAAAVAITNLDAKFWPHGSNAAKAIRDNI